MSPGSVTALHFMRHSQLLATAADTGGLVKLWDVRMLHAPAADLLPGDLLPGEGPPHLNVVPSNGCMDSPGAKGVVCISEDADGPHRSSLTPSALIATSQKVLCP